MNSELLLSTILLAMSQGVLGQSIMESDMELQARIMALDEQAWEAWKDNDREWFRQNVTDEFLSISSEGVSDKAQVVKATPSSCRSSPALDNFKFVRLHIHAVLLAYSATRDAVCDGKAAPVAIQVAVNDVRRGD
jgi:hypothetical protein